MQKEVEFTGVTQNRNYVEFHGPWLLALEIPVGVIQFCGISRGVKLDFICLEFPMVKWQILILKIPGVFFQKLCPQPLLLGFFLE